MKRYRPVVSFVALAILASAAVAGKGEKTEVQYMAVFMDGKKIGHVKSTRDVSADRITTAETVQLVIHRDGISLPISLTESWVETAGGKPVSFRSVQEFGIGEQTVTGRVGADGEVTITSVGIQGTRRQKLPWPAGALGPEGLRQLGVKKGLAKGVRYQAKSLFLSSVSEISLRVTVGETRPVDLLGRVVELTEVKTVIAGPMGGTTVTEYVDADLAPQKTLMDMVGMKLEMIVCSKEVATSPNDPLDFLAKTLVACPISLEEAVRGKSVSYHLAGKNGKKLLLPDTDNQTARVRDGKTVVTVTPAQAPAGARFPYQGDDKTALAALKPSRFVQSDDKRIVALARKAVGDEKDAGRAASKIEAFVASYITRKDLSVGYASATEVAQSRQGDCTEHAVLLAAMCRAVGIPAEVVSGMVYVDRHRDRRHVFAPHAWNRVLIGGKWIGLDAAYGGHGAGHIALLTGNGDLDEFFGIVSTMGNFTIEEVVVKSN